MTKISSVEERLSRLEGQMHTLSTLSDETQNQISNYQQHTKRKSPLADATHDDKENQRSSNSRSSTNSNGHHMQSEAASRLRFQLESCSWPPKPSVFARP